MFALLTRQGATALALAAATTGHGAFGQTCHRRLDPTVAVVPAETASLVRQLSTRSRRLIAASLRRDPGGTPVVPADELRPRSRDQLWAEFVAPAVVSRDTLALALVELMSGLEVGVMEEEAEIGALLYERFSLPSEPAAALAADGIVPWRARGRALRVLTRLAPDTTAMNAALTVLCDLDRRTPTSSARTLLEARALNSEEYEVFVRAMMLLERVASAGTRAPLHLFLRADGPIAVTVRRDFPELW